MEAVISGSCAAREDVATRIVSGWDHPCSPDSIPAPLCQTHTHWEDTIQESPLFGWRAFTLRLRSSVKVKQWFEIQRPTRVNIWSECLNTHANQADLLSGEIPPRWDPTLTYCFCYLAEMGVWLLSRISTAECNNFARHTEIPGHKGWTFGPKPPKNYKKIVVRQYRTARFPISPEREEERAEYLEISISLEQKLFTAQCDMQIITED